MTMTVPVRQASFTGGMLSTGLHARTNLKRFGDSVRLLRNMIPLYDGPVCNRPGLLHLGSAKVNTGAARLVPFIFSSGSLARAFVLEFTAGVIRIWKDDALVLSGGSPVEVVTPYTAEDLPRLKFTQLGQVLTIFCKQRTRRKLTWISDTSWQIAEVAITRAISAPTGLAWTVTPPGDSVVAAKTWQVVVTAVKAGTGEESLPSSATPATAAAITGNKPAQYAWNAVAGAESYNIYRGRNGKFGFVGTAVGTTVFNDDGQWPVFAESPPTDRNPFPGADDQPQVGTYHDQRMACANAWNNPGEVEMSRMGEFDNFDRAIPPKATDAVTFNVSSAQYEEIRSLVSFGRSLLVMTNAMELLVTGSEGVITQDDVVFDDQPTKWGSSWLDPLLIGTAVIFVQDVGATVRELFPLNKGDGADLSILARDLFIGRQVVSWCYAHEPFRVIWAVLDDGSLVSCTYVRQLDVWAWAKHDTGADLFEGVCAVPSSGEHVVTALVKRYVGGQWVRRVERFASRVNQALVDGVFLDGSITYSGAPATVINGLSHLEGRQVYALADGVPVGPFTVSGGSITLGAAASKVHVGLRVTAQGHTLDMYSTEEEVRPRKKLVKRVFVEVKDSRPFRMGQRLTDSLELATHPDGDAWAGLFTGLVTVAPNGDWDSGGAVVWEHTDATPLTIMSIIREVDYGG